MSAIRHDDLFLSMCESKTIWWDGCLWLINQTRLPGELLTLSMKIVGQLIEAINAWRVRGTLALGVAVAYGVALAAELSQASNALELMTELENAAYMIKASRPTAVNFSWGVDRFTQAVALQ
jgi:methylthioribose-1-phosphate isomerase